MKGLILKDFINLKKNFKTLGLILVFYAFLAFSTNNPGFISTMTTVIFAMLTLTTYSYDDYAKWDTYALTLPIGKKHIVQGKYLLLIILSAISFIFSSIALFILDVAADKQDFREGLVITALGAAVVIFFNCIIIPLVTKLGVEKARLAIFAVYGIPFFLGTIILKKLKARSPEPPASFVAAMNTFVNNAYIIIPLLLIATLLISYYITLSIYNKKEF